MSCQAPTATQLSLPPSPLLSLVDELLLNIIDHIPSHSTLCLLSSTCSRFQALVEPYIWRSLLVLTGRHARYMAQAFDAREERISYVQKLAIRYKDEHKTGIEDMNYYLGLMGRLKELHIESPCPNNSEWRSGVYFDGWCSIDFGGLLAGSVYEKVGVERTLPMLQSLTLHGHGSGDRKFVLGNAKAMFFHPALRNITISCSNFEADMDEKMVAAKQMSTPLQSLTLIECNVDMQFLDLVLSLPKALRELSIGERLHVFDCKPSMDPKKRTSSAQFLTALQKQAHSLQRLEHIGGQLEYIPPRDTDPDGAAKLRSLHRLETLELGLESHLNYYLRANGFPPSLKTLKMLDGALPMVWGPGLGPRSMSDVAFHSVTTLVRNCMPPSITPDFKVHLNFADRSIPTVDVRTTRRGRDRQFVDHVFDRPAIYQIARILASYNARFVISRQEFPSRTSYIPPYMYGEETPVERQIYDSKYFWVFHGRDYQIKDDAKLRRELAGKDMLDACLRCIKRGFGFDCSNFGDRQTCSQCSRAHLTCRYDDPVDEGDVNGGVEAEADAGTEAGLQQVLFM